MNHSKTDKIAGYRKRVDNVLTRIPRLMDLEDELGTLRQELLDRHPVYNKYLFSSGVLQHGHTGLFAIPTLQDFEDWILKTDSELKEPILKYKQEWQRLLNSIRRATLHRSEVAGNLGSRFSELDVKDFYAFASIFEAEILDEEMIKPGRKKWAIKITRSDLVVINEKWNALRPKLNQIEDKAKQKHDPGLTQEELNNLSFLTAQKEIRAEALAAVVAGGLAGMTQAAVSLPAGDRAAEVMRSMCANDKKYYSWTADEWADHLKASKPTIIGCPAWDEIKQWREAKKQSAMPVKTAMQKAESSRRKQHEKLAE